MLCLGVSAHKARNKRLRVGSCAGQECRPPTCCLAVPQAPLVPPGTPVVNALAKQRAMLENVLRACIGLSPESNMMLEFK